MNRAERRRAEREANRDIDSGLDPAAMSEVHMVALIHRIHRHVQLAKRRGTVEPITSALYSLMDGTDKKCSDAPRACSKGCWYCSTIWTAASSAEIFGFLNAFTGSHRAALSAKVEAAMPDIAGKTFDDRDAITICPALNDNLCSGYDVRPIVCRTAASVDADVCKRSYLDLSGENIPTPMMGMLVRGTYAAALECALKQEGLASTSYEFQASLSRALSDSSLEKRWLGGEDVFAGIPEDPRAPGDVAAINRLSAMAFG